MKDNYFHINRIEILLFFLLVFKQAVSGQAPAADFKANSTNAYTYSSTANMSVDFYDLSSNSPTSWLWTFSGGSPSSSTLQNPSCITYSVTGTYDVTLVATNGSGNNSITKSGYITVSSPPQGTYGHLTMAPGSSFPSSLGTHTDASSYPVNVYGSWFITSDTGWVVGYNGMIRKTTNGSNTTPTWSCQSSGVSVSLMSAYAINSNICYAVGLSGTILKTTDGGATWTKLISGTTVTLWCVWFTNASNGYISGSNGTILKTSDGGTTWRSLTSGTSADLHGICFPTATKGCAVGTGGVIIYTTDSAGWSSAASGTSYTLNAVNFRQGSAIGYAVGVNGTILKSTTSGATWTTINNSSTATLYSVQSLAGLVNGSCTTNAGFFTVGDQYWSYSDSATCGNTNTSGSGGLYYTSWNPPNTTTYLGFIGTGTSAMISPLPVNLLYFMGECKNDFNKLSWSTASEVNNNYFVIERAIGSANKMELSWQTVGTVKGAGNSTTVKTYEFTDTAPLLYSKDVASRMSYYRISQNDYDGKYSYFPEIAISCANKENDVSLYPNPASDEILISSNFYSSADEVSEIIIYDLLGNTILHQSIKTPNNNKASGIIKVDITSLMAGTYIATISTGTQIYYHKLIVSK